MSKEQSDLLIKLLGETSNINNADTEDNNTEENCNNTEDNNIAEDNKNTEDNNTDTDGDTYSTYEVLQVT